VTYSYTQISQYLTCPRRYRYRYLDGWKEKDNRAAMLFGRAFEQALGAIFKKEDPGEVLFREWSSYKGPELQFSNRDSWDRMF
jgi:CRISPR/Cas system-associated exonuclease Cas4 (RecB family)